MSQKVSISDEVSVPSAKSCGQQRGSGSMMAIGEHFSRAQAFCLIGFACYWVWVFCALLTNALAPLFGEGALIDVWLVSTAAHLVTLLALGFLAGRFSSYLDNALMFVLASSACLAGLLLMLVANNYAGSADLLVSAGAIVAGVGTGCLVTLWAELFVRCCAGYQLVAFLFLGVIAAAIMEIVLGLLPQEGLLIALVVLPCVSVAALYGGSRASCGSLVAAKTEVRAVMSWRFIAYCLVFPVPLGLFQTWFQGHGATLAGWIPILAISVVVLVAVFAADQVFYRYKRMGIAEKLIMPVSVAGLFFLASFDSGASLAGGVLVFVSQQIMSAVLYARFGLIALREEVAPAKVFALGIAATDLGFVVGIAAGNLLHSVFANHGLYLILGIGYVVMMTAFLGTGGLVRKDAATPLSDAAALETSIRDVARGHGLTKREAEILEHLSRGKSVPAIATEVFLSVNTVRTHIAHIYQKFDVHSRDELVTAIDEALRNN